MGILETIASIWEWGVRMMPPLKWAWERRHRLSPRAASFIETGGAWFEYKIINGVDTPRLVPSIRLSPFLKSRTARRVVLDVGIKNCPIRHILDAEVFSSELHANGEFWTTVIFPLTQQEALSIQADIKSNAEASAVLTGVNVTTSNGSFLGGRVEIKIRTINPFVIDPEDRTPKEDF